MQNTTTSNDSQVLHPSAARSIDQFKNEVLRFLNELITYAVSARCSYPQEHAADAERRLKCGFSYYEPKLKEMFAWLFSSRELSNFTYSITPQNKLYLTSMIALVTGIPTQKIDAYADELCGDKEIRAHVKTFIDAGDKYMAIDPHFDFGRRLGWYLIVRSLKPRVVVETGVQQGLGSIVLASALLRNREEGFEGRYYGTEINTQVGFLLAGKYKEVGEILFGDSITSLKNFNKPIDIFINDSDHTGEYEWNEYLTIENKLSDRAVILADNAHVTDKLCLFARKTNRKFMYFQEKPEAHWYPGAGIGIAY